MTPEQPILRQSIAAERARLLDLLWQNIVALRQLVHESQQLIDAARYDARGKLPLTARDTSS